ncbi:MAG: amidohydrolase [Nitriliruptorales bacterium]|nr:amidohydrolase [Nitriliruptorales bacterium]
MSLLVTNAQLDGSAVDLRCVDGVITSIGELEPETGETVLDGNGMALVPGLVNAHTHAAMTLFRSRGDDLPLMRWLQEAVWPAEARMTADDVLWGTRLAALEMVRSGTTHFWDMYWHPDAVAQAVRDVGLRATVSTVVFDGGPGADDAKRAEVRRDVESQLARLEPLVGHRVSLSMGPHAVYTVSEPTLRWVAEVAEERGLPIQIHLSETRGEVDDCVAATGVRPPRLLERNGLLHDRLLAAHGCWLDDDEIDLLAAAGATVATCPVSNMKLATGQLFPLSKAMRHGVHAGLGTDGAGSNNSLDLLEDAKIVTLLAKHEKVDAAAMNARETFDLAAGRHSPLLGGRSIEVDAPADFLLVDLDTPELAGGGDLYGNLVYGNAASSIDTVVVAGRIVMRGRVIADEDEIVAEAAARARRLLDS